ncbi:putative reverse transcriptase domain-containing protein, partial [Tanacetum coccineum]
MLRAYVIDFGGSWDVHLLLAEFSYNNSYHSSIRCASFEELYGKKCRSPVLWAEIRENRLSGPKLVQETTDKVVLIKEKLKAARDRQKNYADNRRKPLEFEVGDLVLLKVSPWKGVIRFGKKGKLAPRLKRSKISIVKVRWNSKHGPEFTWEHEVHMKAKYPRLFADCAVEHVVGLAFVWHFAAKISQFLQNILDLYFKYFKLSEDVVNRILQVVLDLQHFKSSLVIFAATILQSSSALHHISNIDNYVHQIIEFQSILITS